MPAPLKLRDAVVVEGDCWLWQGGKTWGGYGTWRGTTAHRVVYEMLVGAIPDGLQLDHLCRQRACVNPDHLEPVTCRENLRRGTGHGGETHCPQGHPYDEENTRWRSRRSGRECRACDRERYHRRVAQGWTR